MTTLFSSILAMALAAQYKAGQFTARSSTIRASRSRTGRLFFSTPRPWAGRGPGRVADEDRRPGEISVLPPRGRTHSFLPSLGLSSGLGRRVSARAVHRRLT